MRYSLFYKLSTTQWFVTVGLIICLLAIVFIFEQSRVQRLGHSPAVINVAGKQRMLSQRISYLQYLTVTQSASAQKQSWQSELRFLVKEFEINHQRLTGQSLFSEDFRVQLSPELQAHYFDNSPSLDVMVTDFLKKVSLTSQTNQTDNVEQYSIAITPEQSTQLLAELDRAVALFEQWSEKQAAQLKLATYLIWFVVVALIALIMRSILRTANRIIQAERKTQQRVSQALADAKKQVELYDKQRVHYLDKITHDLRSPVSAIMSVIDLLPNQKSDRDILLRQAELSCQRLLKYTDNLADIIKPRADPGNRRQFSLIATLDDSFARTANACELKGLAFNLTCVDVLNNEVIGYPKAIRKCLENILDNAVKYTAEGSVSVDIELKPLKDGSQNLICTISDTGDGIPEDVQSNAFERFSVLDRTRGLVRPVVGMGMAITKECIEDIGGSISLSSHAKAGTTVSLTFPLTLIASEFIEHPADNNSNDLIFAVVDDLEVSRQHLCNLIARAGYRCDVYSTSLELFEQKQAIAAYSGLIIDYYLPGLNGEELVMTMKAMLGERMPPVIVVSSSPEIANIIARSATNAWQVFTKPIMENRFIDAVKQLATVSGEMVVQKSARILLVEDEKINAEMVTYMLESMRYEVHVANDGNTAITLFSAYEFDCILLDIHLPDIDGVSLLAQFKKLGNVPPTIVLSGDSQEETENIAISMGVRYYLKKPVPYQELKNTLRMTLSPNRENKSA